MSEEIQDISSEATQDVAPSTEETQEQVTQSDEAPVFKAKFEGHEAPSNNEEPPAQEQQGDPLSEETPEVSESSTPSMEKIDEEEVKDTSLSENIDESSESKWELPNDAPEWLQKQYQFHKETGGNQEDYARATQDISNVDEDTLLKEFIKVKNPAFSEEEIEWEFEYLFGDDEDFDEESREFKKAVLKKKRMLGEAESHFKGIQEKYKADLKAGAGNVPEEYKEAYSVVQQQKEQAKQQEAWRENFVKQTDSVFSDEWRGFDFDTGEGKFRIVETNAIAIKDGQTDLNQFVGEFLDENGNVSNASEYHKALYAAKNSDKIAKHFYQQGKADALKERAKSTKNIDMTPKAQNSAPSGGTKFKFLNADKFGR